MEQYNDLNYLTENVKPKSNLGMKIILGCLIILFLLCVGSFVVLSYFPEVIFSPQTLYLQAEKNAGNNFIKTLNNLFDDDMYKTILKAYETPYAYKGEISLKDILTSSKLTFDILEDIKNEKVRNKFSLIIKGNKLIDVDIFQNKNLLGIKVPVLYSKYITLDGDNLLPIYEKFNLPSEGLPKKLIRDSQVFEILDLPNAKKELNEIIPNYIKFYADFMKNADVKFTKNVKISTSEGDIKCNQLTLRLDQKKINDFAIQLSEKIADDDKLLDLVLGRYTKILKLYQEAGYYSDLPRNTPDVSTLKQEFRNWVKEFKNQVKENKEDIEVIMTLFVNRGFNVLKREIKIVNKSDQNTPQKPEMVITFSGYKMPKSKTYNTTMELITKNVNYDSTTAIIRFNNLESSVNNGKGKNNKITFEISKKDDKKEQSLMKLNLDFNQIEDKNKQTNTNGTFELTFGSISSNPKLSGKFTSETNRNQKDETFSGKYNIDVDITLPESAKAKSDKIGFTLDLNEQYKFNVPVELPEVSGDNSLNINTASVEEIGKVIEEIKTAAGKFVSQNAHLFNIDSSNLGSF